MKCQDKTENNCLKVFQNNTTPILPLGKNWFSKIQSLFVNDKYNLHVIFQLTLSRNAAAQRGIQVPGPLQSTLKNTNISKHLKSA